MASRNVTLSLHVDRRWFFWPAFVVAYALVMLHIVSEQRAANWIAGHVFRIETR